jgi:hypothetical protein
MASSLSHIMVLSIHHTGTAACRILWVWCSLQWYNVTTKFHENLPSCSPLLNVYRKAWLAVIWSWDSCRCAWHHHHHYPISWLWSSALVNISCLYKCNSTVIITAEKTETNKYTATNSMFRNCLRHILSNCSYLKTYASQTDRSSFCQWKEDGLFR